MLVSPNRRLGRRLATAAAAVGLALVPTAAFAGSSGTGTVQASLLGGSLSVNSVTGAASPISATIGGTGSGDLPTVQMQDATGTGAGWNGQVAVSDLNYTGTWSPVSGSTALSNTTSAAFTDAVDGVTYTVTVGSGGITAGVGTFTYTSTDSSDASGTDTAAANTANAVGTKGLTIDFGTQNLTAGEAYTIHVGTQAASALSLDTGASGAGVSTVNGNTAPVLVNNGVTVSGGGAAATAYGSAVKFASAAIGTGMGEYNVVPGATFNPDPNSFAATYSAGVQYSIVVGP